jgi:hypothetical protein
MLSARLLLQHRLAKERGDEQCVENLVPFRKPFQRSWPAENIEPTGRERYLNTICLDMVGVPCHIFQK